MGSVGMPLVSSRGAWSCTNRIERIATISLNAINTVFTLPTNGGLIPNDRFIRSLMLTFRGRCTNAGANNPTGTQADGVWNLLGEVRVEGHHRIRGAMESFFVLRGPEIRELNRMYSAIAPPFTPATLALGAAATNDIMFTLMIPFTPLGLSIQAQKGWLLDAPNYENLRLSVTFTDDLNILTGQTAASTFSAFGSAVGSPTLEVLGEFAQAGPSRAAGFVPGRVWRFYREATGSNLTTTATGVRLFELPRGFRIRSTSFKTGAKSTAVSPGNNAYNTLSDAILTNLELNRGTNRILRSWNRSAQIQFYNQQTKGLPDSAGYQLVDFLSHGADGEVLDLTTAIAGPTGDIDAFLRADVTGAANQAALAVYEEWHQGPMQLARRAQQSR